MFFRAGENAPPVNQETNASFGETQNSFPPPQNFSPPQNFYQQPQFYNHQTPPKQKIGMALTSMIMGLIGCFFTAPVGLVLGIAAVKKANRAPREYGGKGFAVAGIVLNTLALLFLPLVLAVAIPNFLAAVRAANEASAIATIRTIAAAEEKYMPSMAGRCGDIQALIAGRLLDVALASNEKNGYRFMVVSLPEGGCEIYAAPITTSYGTRSFFYSTEDGIIRAGIKNGLQASASDPPIEDSMSKPPKIASQKNKP
jgi:Tfp pilus assembly protein PilE